ncbi:hypothetical protein ACFLTA_03100 [Bacteroidota bacterium]
MKRKIQKTAIASFILVSCFSNLFGQEAINVDVNLNVKHTVGGISEFDRSKFITVHTHQTEVAWEDGDMEQLRYLLNDLDVYMGRDNETGHRDLQVIREDPNKPGYPDIEQMKKLGLKARKRYDKNTQWHEFESRNNLIITTHTFPLYPGQGRANKKGWIPANASASGQWVANHIKEYYGDRDGIHGEPVPQYFEVVNEPMWFMIHRDGLNIIPKEIFEYHNTMADEIRAAGNDIMIGGYCAAFPNFDQDDFQRWEKRHKLFIDMSGEKMDFYTVHLYDQPIWETEWRRSGSNIEATFDMLEHYNVLRHGDVKPIMCTELGSQQVGQRGPVKFPYHQWVYMKALTSELMSFMDRPDNVLTALPYIVGTGSYQFHRDPSVPSQTWAILEVDENGKWTKFNEYIKFYQLWADVNGTRVDSEPADLDIQVDAYVDGKDAYLILDNLDFEPRIVKLNIKEEAGLHPKEVMVKHFHLVDSFPVIDTIMYSSPPEELKLDAAGSMIVRYTFSDPVPIDHTSEEVKYYADSYLKKIEAGKANVFKIANVLKGSNGEAVLRLGVGREHGKSLSPLITFNGTEIQVPSDCRGEDQLKREAYFGVREIPVPYELLRKNNTVAVTFADEGGHISSVTLRAFEFSKELPRSFK